MRLSLRTFFSALAVVAAGATLGHAGELSSALFDPFKPQSEDAAAGSEVTLVSHGHCNGDGMCNGDCCKPSEHVGRDFLVCKNRCGMILAGAEMVMLRPYANDNILDPGGAGAADLNFVPSWRTWVGLQSADGLGGRLRYWEIDRGTTGAGGTAVGVEFRTLDAELTQTVDFRRWNLLMAGGVRYGEANVNKTTTAGTGSFDSGFDGVGLTFAGQATRDLTRSGALRMAMSGRWSALYGNRSSAFAITAGPLPAPTIERDELVNILELKIGPVYSRRFLGGVLTMGGGLEAQYWSNGVDVDPTLTSIDTDDVGFIGFASSIMYSR